MNTFEIATFGGGCFWCTEAVFQNLKGVLTVESGYAGGDVSDPSYEQVCMGNTGHAEVIQITFDPSLISYEDLLEVFWKTHDPTTMNRQGADVGTQYRSVVFYHSDDQRVKANEVKKKLSDERIWDKPIVTEISPLTNYYKAENYHQNYYNTHSSQPYCSFVITPKIQKLKKNFAEKLKNQ